MEMTSAPSAAPSPLNSLFTSLRQTNRQVVVESKVQTDRQTVVFFFFGCLGSWKVEKGNCTFQFCWIFVNKYFLIFIGCLFA